MDLTVNNMCSDYSKAIFIDALAKMNLHALVVLPGRSRIIENITSEQRSNLNKLLIQANMWVVDDEDSSVVTKTINAIDKLLNLPDKPKGKYSDFIADEVELTYSYISSEFSKAMPFTIEEYIIRAKVNKVQMLLIAGKRVKDIAFDMFYSSSAALCNNFKYVAGMTTSDFKKNGFRYIDYTTPIFAKS